MELIRDFKKLNREDAAIAGGKGASLGEMTQVGIPVPSGFVILSNSFEKFLEETDLNVEIDSILHSVDHNEIHTVENASEKIKALILNAEIPQNIFVDIQKIFKKLDSKFVAVRSSATAEDSLAASWAGQLESYLNSTEANLLENVKKCWASLFTPRAIFYRFEKELHKQKISVAVVVQKMVESKVSGVAFSVHPITQDKNQLIIEAGLGLGEAIVSGQITPDSYVVKKEPREIIDKNIQVQTRGLYRSDKGGNKWRDISKEQGEKQVLSDKEILELSDIIIRIENHYGFPVDTEWAKEANAFYIVQSRPITSLKQNKPETIYEKSMNRSMSVIDCQCWYLGEKISLPKISNRAIFFEPMFIYRSTKGVGVYYNYTDIAQDPKFLVDHFSANVKKFYNISEQYKKDCSKIIELSKRKRSADFSALFKLIVDFWGKLAVIMVLGESKTIDRDLSKASYELRKKYDTVLYQAGESLLEMARQKIPPSYAKLVEFLTFEEIEYRQLPEIKELRKRIHGYVFFKDNLIVAADIEKFAQDQNLNIINAKHNVKTNSKFVKIKGNNACAGKVIGTARIVFEYAQLKKLKKGDILITSMTTPNFLPAMKRAIAFVTDEGGITCHAAIVAREMNKPCIIGTKIATEVLKDGDKIEVDANSGIVKLLN